MHYINVPEYKPLHEAPRRLRELEEARDLLLNISLKEVFCIAIFRFGAVALPGELEPQLRELVGREIAILRLDGRYYLREVVASA